MRKLGAIIIYLLVLLYATGYRIQDIIDVKGMALVMIGTVFLTLAGYQKEMDKAAVRELAGFNAMVAAYLTAFIFLFSLYHENSSMALAVLALRPILYGYILHIILKEMPTKRGKEAPLTQTQEIVQVQTSPIVEESEPLKKLTEREWEIARLVKQGLSNKEIGGNLYISEATVKKHLSNIFDKLQISNREQLKNLM